MSNLLVRLLLCCGLVFSSQVSWAEIVYDVIAEGEESPPAGEGYTHQRLGGFSQDIIGGYYEVFTGDNYFIGTNNKTIIELFLNALFEKVRKVGKHYYLAGSLNVPGDTPNLPINVYFALPSGANLNPGAGEHSCKLTYSGDKTGEKLINIRDNCAPENEFGGFDFAAFESKSPVCIKKDSYADILESGAVKSGFMINFPLVNKIHFKIDCDVPSGYGNTTSTEHDELYLEVVTNDQENLSPYGYVGMYNDLVISNYSHSSDQEILDQLAEAKTAVTNINASLKAANASTGAHLWSNKEDLRLWVQSKHNHACHMEFSAQEGTMFLKTDPFILEAYSSQIQLRNLTFKKALLDSLQGNPIGKIPFMKAELKCLKTKLTNASITNTSVYDYLTSAETANFRDNLETRYVATIYIFENFDKLGKSDVEIGFPNAFFANNTYFTQSIVYTEQIEFDSSFGIDVSFGVTKMLSVGAGGGVGPAWDTEVDNTLNTNFLLRLVVPQAETGSLYRAKNQPLYGVDRYYVEPIPELTENIDRMTLYYSLLPKTKHVDMNILPSSGISANGSMSAKFLVAGPTASANGSWTNGMGVAQAMQTDMDLVDIFPEYFNNQRYKLSVAIEYDSDNQCCLRTLSEYFANNAYPTTPQEVIRFALSVDMQNNYKNFIAGEFDSQVVLEAFREFARMKDPEDPTKWFSNPGRLRGIKDALSKGEPVSVTDRNYFNAVSAKIKELVDRNRANTGPAVQDFLCKISTAFTRIANKDQSYTTQAWNLAFNNVNTAGHNLSDSVSSGFYIVKLANVVDPAPPAPEPEAEEPSYICPVDPFIMYDFLD